MTTSAPQWPGQEGIHERRAEARDTQAQNREARDTEAQNTEARDTQARDTEARPSGRPGLRAVPVDGPSAGPSVGLGRARRRVQVRLAGRDNRFGVVRDLTERDLRAARRRARPNLLSAYTFTCRLAYGLTCRSAEAGAPVRLS
jgi:hypothetical protein